MARMSSFHNNAAVQPSSLKPALRALFCATHSDWEHFDDIFDAFWRGMVGESARVNLAAHWLVPTAHNGILQLWLDLGAMGLALFVLAYAVYVRKSLRFYLVNEGYLRAWPLAYMAFLFFYNFTEVTELDQNNIFTMLVAALAATITVRAFEMETDEDKYPSTRDFETQPIYLS